jgi:CRP-like cAMP-binding protein
MGSACSTAPAPDEEAMYRRFAQSPAGAAAAGTTSKRATVVQSLMEMGVAGSTARLAEQQMRPMLAGASHETCVKACVQFITDNGGSVDEAVANEIAQRKPVNANAWSANKRTPRNQDYVTNKIRPTARQSCRFKGKEEIAEELSQSTARTFVPIRTNGNGNCLFNAVILCLRHCADPTLLTAFHETFFTKPFEFAEHVFSDEASAGMEVRIRMASLIDEQSGGSWMKSGISSADHPLMSVEGREKAYVSDGPMVAEQVKRLRDVERTRNGTGIANAAWGDASDDLSTLVKLCPRLRFKVFVGTETEVASVSGTWLHIEAPEGTPGAITAVEDCDPSVQTPWNYIYASGSHFSAICVAQDKELTSGMCEDMFVSRVMKKTETADSANLRMSTAVTSDIIIPEPADAEEEHDIHEALLKEKNKRQKTRMRRKTTVRLAQRTLKNRSKLVKSLQDTPLFEGIDASVVGAILDEMELFFFEKNTTICLQGQIARNCMIVLEGTVQVFQRPRLGMRPKLIAEARPYDLLGEAALGKKKSFRGATLISLKDTVQALVLSRRDYKNMQKRGDLPAEIVDRITARLENNKQRDVGRKATSLLGQRILKGRPNADDNPNSGEKTVKFSNPMGKMLNSTNYATQQSTELTKEEQARIVSDVQRKSASDFHDNLHSQTLEAEAELQKRLQAKQQEGQARTKRRLLKRRQTAMLRASKKSNVLRKIPVFEKLTADQLSSFLVAMQLETYADGQTICKFGDASDRLWVLTKGNVNVLVSEDKKVANVLKPVSVFGETAILEDSAENVATRTSTCVALGAVEILSLARPAFFRLCAELDGEEIVLGLRQTAADIYNFS